MGAEGIRRLYGSNLPFLFRGSRMSFGGGCGSRLRPSAQQRLPVLLAIFADVYAERIFDALLP